MVKVLFVCHGNICRSPMAEFVLKDMVRRRGMEDLFHVESRATSSEEIWGGRGNPVYPPARRILAQHGIFCEGKRARRLTKADYQEYDCIIGMDSENMRWMQRMLDGDPEGKLSLLMDYENTFSATVTVTVSRQFFGWLTAIGSELKLTGPPKVKRQYKKYLEEILTGMEESG
jgi:protein-tyrosine phosphatase